MERDNYKVIRPWSWRMRRHWMTRVLVLLLPPLVLLGVAPMIIAKTSLRNMVVQRALGKFGGTVSIGTASLGWFSPIAASAVTVTDEKGQPLAEVASLKSEKTLLGLALDHVHLGTFYIEGPMAHITLRDDGSNLEDALAPLLAEPASGAAVEYALQITGGGADIASAGGKERWTVREMTGEVQSAQGADTPLTAKLAATLADAAGKTGPLKCDLAWTAGASGGMGAGKATVQTDFVPLALVEAGARRFVKDLTLRGTANAAASYEWKDNGQEQWLQIDNCTVEGLAVASPAYIGKDKLETPLVKAGGRLGLVGDRLRFDRTNVEANLGKVTLTGSLKYAELSSKLMAVLTSALQDEDCQVHGEVDVAELARVLPQTMRLRDDLQITSGHVQVSLGSQGQSPSRTWQGRLETTNLEAVAAGRRVVWDQPIAATLSAQRDTNGGLVADINCRSSFLTVVSHAQAEEGTLVADGDLDRLAQQLQQFFDLGGVKMAGKLRADMNWKTRAADGFNLQGTIDTQKFALTAPGFRPWTEEALHVDVNAAGAASATGIKQIETATVTVISGGDRLDAKLLRPITDVALSTAWPLQVGLKGELATWLPRLQPLFELPGWDISGRIDVKGQTVAASDHVQFEQMTGTFEKLHVHGNGLFLDEPVVKIDTTGTLDMAKQTLVSPVTTVAASAIAFRADQLNVNFKPNNFSVAGDVAFRGDLARLTAWLNDPKIAATQQIYGALDGSAKMIYADGASQVQLQANIENLALAQRAAPAAPAGGLTVVPTAASSDWQTVWQEPKVGLSGKLKHLAAKDLAELDNFTIDSPALRITTKGEVAELSTRQVCNVTGQIDYDWKNVTQRLRGFVGEGVQLTGHDSRAFKIAGPLASAKVTTAAKPGEVAAAAPPFPLDLAAEGSIGWESAQAYGVAVGKGEIAPKLERGVVRCAPVDLALTTGHVKVTPWMDLTHAPYALNLEKGPLAENVQITPEMCGAWLKYMAPLLADVTKAEGRFSVMLEGATIPLNNPYALDGAGTFTILGAQVGPGPLSEQFVTLANQVKSLIDTKGLGAAPATAAGGNATWINLPQQSVPIRVVGGKVYHQGLQMVVRDVVITTSGAVGVDQSLQMTAEVPIRDEWVAKDRLLAGLRGQSLKVPVGGTLSRPQLDWRGLGDLAKQMAGSAAKGAVEDQLRKGLDRFLPQPKK